MNRRDQEAAAGENSSSPIQREAEHLVCASTLCSSMAEEMHITHLPVSKLLTVSYKRDMLP